MNSMAVLMSKVRDWPIRGKWRRIFSLDGSDRVVHATMLVNESVDEVARLGVLQLFIGDAGNFEELAKCGRDVVQLNQEQR